MNRTTIYNTKRSETSALRKAMVIDEFEECGYWVIFYPRASHATVNYRSRQMLNLEKFNELLELIQKHTGKKAKKDKLGRPIISPQVSHPNIIEIGNCHGHFQMGVYQAECFSKDLAKWLDDWHSRRYEWVAIQASKLKSYEENSYEYEF